MEDFYAGLEKRSYPYDIAYVRWSGHGDNAVPDPAICDFVKDWNAKYTWPHFVISGTSEAFRAFEQRYGDRLPQVRGDWTPYWEDGAGSSALETAMNRASSDRLAQAETLFAMLKPAAYPAAAFEDAWNNVLLYSEHTWGADVQHQPAGKPEDPRPMGNQAGLRRSGGQAVARVARAAVARSAPARASDTPDGVTTNAGAVDVFNTLSWPRTGLVTLSKELPPPAIASPTTKARRSPRSGWPRASSSFLRRNVPPFARAALHRGPRLQPKLEAEPPLKARHWTTAPFACASMRRPAASSN